MTAEISNNKPKDIIDMKAIADRAAVMLADDTENVVARHVVPRLLYTIKTIPSGIESDVFTASFAVTQTVRDGRPGISQIDRVGQIGMLNPEITIAEHIEDFMDSNPGVGVVLDKETAIKLGRNESRKLALIDYGDSHCLLTGLNARGIDVYLTPDVESIINLGGFSINILPQT